MDLYLYLNRFCSNKISHRLLFWCNAPSAVGGPLCARPAVGDEDGVGALEGLLHAHGAVRALAHVVRRVQRVLDAHHAGPRAVRHVLETKDIHSHHHQGYVDMGSIQSIETPLAELQGDHGGHGPWLS